MVPDIRPSGYTSILAPTRCGVDPCAATMVTSATSSPRSSALTSSLRTSWLIHLSYRTGRRKPATAFLEIIRSPVEDVFGAARDPVLHDRTEHEDVARRNPVCQADLRRHRHRRRPPGADQGHRTRRLARQQHLQDG